MATGVFDGFECFEFDIRPACGNVPAHSFDPRKEVRWKKHMDTVDGSEIRLTTWDFGKTL